MEAEKNITPEFFIIFQDVWNNKVSFRTTKIGDTIKEIMDQYDLIYPDGEIDFDKYNSDNPYDILTFGRGFYDISFVESDDEDEYAGCIMIFEL